MSSIKQVIHATEPTKGWELTLYHNVGYGYVMTINPYSKSSPDSPFHSSGEESSRKELLLCTRKTAQREKDAIALFDKEVAEFIAANPAKVVEEFVVNVGDRFFHKATKHWDSDKVITIISIEDGRYFGITDQQIKEGDWRSRCYSYAELVDLERREPATQDQLDEIERHQLAQTEAVSQANQERQALIEKGRTLVPSWAKAAIVAKLLKNESDSQTDYFGGSVIDKRVLGFSRSDRNDFSEMRKFAALFDGTAHLTEKEHENRENYSGGGGYYLGTHRYHGWQVEKNSYGLHSDDLLYALGKYGLPVAQVDEVSLQPEANGVVVRHNEAQNGIEVVFPAKPEPSVIEKLKSLGFRWSRANSLWYTKYSEMRERQVRAALGVA